jgi:hypothetical protein
MSSEFKRRGLSGLVRKERTDVGERRITLHRLREAIEGLALEKAPLPRSVHRFNVYNLHRDNSRPRQADASGSSLGSVSQVSICR